MGTEIERRFLVADLPAYWLAQAQAHPIQQGYLLTEPDRVLRVRQKDDQFIMTVKSGQGLSRQEEEQTISAELFAMLWPLTIGRRNVKTRHVRTLDGLVYELDIFAENLAPLVMLEVEFRDEAQAHAFTPPSFVRREVTEDGRYTNAALALHGLPDDFAA